MAKRRHYQKQKFKIKLKKNTVYSIFAFGVILSGILLGSSFAKTGPALTTINDYIKAYFGFLSFLVPILLIILGFFFLRLKLFLSRPNVSVGFFILLLSLLGLTKEGMIGNYLNQLIAEVLNGFGAFAIYLAGVLIGIIVLFDTSLDEVFQVISAVLGFIPKLFPGRILAFFQKKQIPALGNKEMVIKGMEDNKNKDIKINSNVVKKDEPFISDKLVMNTPGKPGVWKLPPLDLLSSDSSQKADRGDVKKIATLIEDTLKSFGIGARVVEVNLGPAVTQYALQIPLGTKVSKITNLANDLALNTEAPTGQIRIEAPIPGRNLVGVEIPNKSLEVVSLRTMLSSEPMRKSKSKLAVSLGLDVSGNPLLADIGKMPHVLIAGTTGSGKSVMINSFIASLLFRATPDEIRIIMIDPKRVELTGYNGIPHLMTPVIVEVDKILASLKWAMSEMDRRYKTFAEHGVRNIDSYNELAGFQRLPYIVIFIDELADLMAYAPVEVEDAIARLAQMARATGIHLVVSTQRPSVDVITGLIKANIPCRIAFNVSSMIDSRVIIDMPGAEKLLGRGDMLYIPPDQAKPSRIQGAFVSEKEVRGLVDFLKNENPPVQYTEEVLAEPLIAAKKGMASMGGDGKDALFDESVRIICQHDKASASLLQRRLSIGYSRAARILDQLEAVGAVGRQEGSKPRDVLITNADEFIANVSQNQ
ncbi:MAG: DNA translocase FtsK [Candidatus Levybacteria bacterium]|nr:DNA translocase FtsK [Candidatus Levybacteria bacterium]